MTARKTPYKPKKPSHRYGPPTDAEHALVAAVVADQPATITPAQTKALGTVLRRTESAVEKMINKAREKFVLSAEQYVDLHKKATEKALAKGDLMVATKAAQWALANMSAEGVRVVDKPSADVGGSRINIGIRVGGVDAPMDAITVEPTE